MEREQVNITIEEQERWAAEALKGVKEEDVFASSKLSDAVFLVSLRDKINARTTAVYRRVFPSFRTVAAVTSVCVVLLVAIIVGERFSTIVPLQFAETKTNKVTAPSESAPLAAQEPSATSKMMIAPQTTDMAMSIAEENVPGENRALPISVESLANSGVDPLELAAYLDVPEFVEADVADTTEDLPLTDQLLALDMGTLEEVLTNLEDTEFF